MKDAQTKKEIKRRLDKIIQTCNNQVRQKCMTIGKKKYDRKRSVEKEVDKER